MVASRLLRLLPGILFIVVLLAALEIAVATGMANATLSPPPSRIAAEVIRLIGSGKVWAPLGHTLSLLAAGYALACVFGVLIGILMGQYRWLYNLLEPLVELLRPLPKPALLPPLMLLLGLGSAMKISIVALGATFPILINALQAARGVDSVLVNTARTLGHGGVAILWRVVLPSTAPMVLAGMKVSLGLSLVLVILAEMLSATGGLGAVIIDMQRSFRVTEMYAWVVILSIVGLSLVSVFNFIQRRLTFWQAGGAL